MSLNLFYFLIQLSSVSFSLALKCYQCENCPVVSGKPSLCPFGHSTCFTNSSNFLISRGCSKTSEAKCIFSEGERLCWCRGKGCNHQSIHFPFNCFQCKNCPPISQVPLKSCPLGTKGCFSFFFNNTLKEMGCSLETKGSVLINGKYKFVYCDGSGCNQDILLSNKPSTTFVTKATSIMCYQCEDCKESLGQEVFCPESNGCQQLFDGKSLKRSCAPEGLNVCHSSEVGPMIGGCRCGGDLCNGALLSQPKIHCPQCNNCQGFQEEFLDECPLGGQNCFKIKIEGEPTSYGCTGEGVGKLVDTNFEMTITPSF